MSGAGTSEPVTTGINTVTSNARQLSDGNGETGGPGTSLGRSVKDKVGFFGVTPVVQPGQNGLPARTTANVTIWATTQTPTAVTANTSAEKAMTITGVLATDMVAVVNKPTAQAGLLVGSGRVSAANTIQVTFGNDTGSTVTPTVGETYEVITLGANLQTTAALTPAAVGPNTTSEQFFSVPCSVGQVVFVNKPTSQAGLMVVNARVASANQVAIQFQNLTAATITPSAAETWTFGFVAALSPAPVMTKITQTLTPNAVAANTTAEQTFTVAGLVAGTEVYVMKPSVTLNLVVAGFRVSAANTLAITFANNSGSSITPPAETYSIAYFTTTAPAAGGGTVLPSQRGEPSAALVQVGLLA